MGMKCALSRTRVGARAGILVLARKWCGSSRAKASSRRGSFRDTEDVLGGLHSSALITLMVLTSLSCITGSILSSFLDMTQLATLPSEEMLKKLSSFDWSSFCQHTYVDVCVRPSADLTLICFGATRKISYKEPPAQRLAKPTHKKGGEGVRAKHLQKTRALDRG